MKQTFAGDQREFDPESFVGANGRFFRPVSAEFDGERTEITYERVPMEEMPQRYGHLIDVANARGDIIETFGGQW
jgi:hypothetical protein